MSFPGLTDVEIADRWLPRRLRGRRATAILPVHAFGQPADMDPILAVARESGLAVIEDACEALARNTRGAKPAPCNDDCGVMSSDRQA